MSRLLSTLRASALFTAIVIVACLPGVAVDWLTAPLTGGPRMMPTAERSSVVPGDDLPALPPAPFLVEEEPPLEFDLRGNEIVRPVERYSVDHRGSLYELHSPQTEIPRLAPPEL